MRGILEWAVASNRAATRNAELALVRLAAATAEREDVARYVADVRARRAQAG
jgi:hypothetical protein